MEKKTIAMLVVSAMILILGIVFACGIGRGGEVIYQKPQRRSGGHDHTGG